jgi:hypothetical protein
MLASKVEDFVGEESDETFPEFHSLNESELLCHRNRLRDVFGCDKSMPILDVFSRVVQLSKFISNISAKDSDFDFSNVLNSEGIKSKGEIYIDWKRFDDIDCMQLPLFTKYFDDIWYPEADDIYIYDETFKWFLLITHYGAISIAKLENEIDRHYIS